jgi:hypothetical protein
MRACKSSARARAAGDRIVVALTALGAGNWPY